MAISSYKVVWLDEAIENKEAIRRYLQENWSEKEVQQFFRKLDERIALISRHPKAFRETKAQKNVRKSVLTKQITIYYKFEDDLIEILFIFDTRQDPDKLDLT